MFNKLLSLNVPIQGIPLFTYILIGATTLVLAVVTLNETPQPENENTNQSETSSPEINNSVSGYSSEGGKNKSRQTKKHKPSKKLRQSTKRK